MPRFLFTFTCALAVLTLAAQAQPPRPSAWPFGTPTPTATAVPALSTPPPRGVPLFEKRWAELSNSVVTPLGSSALSLKPEQWKHAETENFVLHFRRVRDANEVARAIEFDLWFEAKELGATKEQYERKSHVYIFKDEREWQKFLGESGQPAWSHSFARNDELFLDVREDSGAFDSENVAHETTHAVVSRLYGRKRWPIWLNEGFAEYMGRASVAARHSQSLRRSQDYLPAAQLSFTELISTARYPSDRQQVHQLYESAEKLVRFLWNKYPKELFPQFVDRVIAGEPAQTALPAVYGAEFNDLPAFERKFARFTR